MQKSDQQQIYVQVQVAQDDHDCPHGPHPGQHRGQYAALEWVWDNAPKLRLDRARIAVGGDSAGGALAAACALRARDKGGPRLCFRLLVYPVTDCRMETASMTKYTDSPL